MDPGARGAGRGPCVETQDVVFMCCPGAVLSLPGWRRGPGGPKAAYPGVSRAGPEGPGIVSGPFFTRSGSVTKPKIWGLSVFVDTRYSALPPNARACLWTSLWEKCGLAVGVSIPGCGAARGLEKPLLVAPSGGGGRERGNTIYCAGYSSYIDRSLALP